MRNLVLLITSVALSISSSMFSSTVDVTWNGQPATLQGAIQTAVNAAKAGTGEAIVRFGSQVYLTDRTIIIIDANDVTFEGNGRANTRLQFDGTAINFIVLQNSTNTLFRNMSISGATFERTNIISCRNSPDLRVNNVKMQLGRFGITGWENATEIYYAEGLRAINCTFEDFRRGIHFGRNNRKRVTTSIKRVVVDGCVFSSSNTSDRYIRSGFYIDAGNDDGAPSATIPWDFNNSVIRNCRFLRSNSLASGTRGVHGIALANCKNVNIEANEFLVGEADTRRAQGIHIEDHSENITINNRNTFNNISTNSGIEITLTGVNEDNNATILESAPNRNILIENNDFIGSSQSCINGSNNIDVIIRNNNFIGNYVNSNRVSLFRAPRLFQAGIDSFNKNITVLNNQGLSITRTNTNGFIKQGFNATNVSIVSVYTDMPETINLVTTLSSQIFVNEKSKTNTIKVYPTVVSSELNIISGIVINKIELYNSSGTKVLNLTRRNIKKLNVSNLSSGLYILKTISKNGYIEINKFLKK